LGDGWLCEKKEPSHKVELNDESKYFEIVEHYHEAVKPEPELHATLGLIPPFKTNHYVSRGDVEDKILARLKAGGTGAIVGVNAPGGVGKTELAKHVCAALKSEFKDNVLWVDVGDKTPSQIVDAMIVKLNVPLPSNANDEIRLNELRHVLMARGRMLIVFDDVRKGSTALLKDLGLPQNCAALITSRIQEVPYVHETFPLHRMTPAQSRELFQGILGEEAVAKESDAIDHLAERCKYNSLAMDIAARRIRQEKDAPHPVRDYLDRAARLPSFRIGEDDLIAVFDISYNDLKSEAGDDDQKRFRALAAFHPSGFSPKAAAHLWNVDADTANEIISRFINLSLVTRAPGDAPRYRLHDLWDEYAAIRLTGSGEEEQVRMALAEWIVNLFSEHSTDDPSSAPEVAVERENLFLSAEWAVKTENANLLARLATKPRNWLSVVFNAQPQWRNWLTIVLNLGLEAEEERGLKANCIKSLGDVHRDLSELPEARTRYEEALPIYRAIGDKLGEANTLSSIMLLDLTRSRNVDEAEKRLEKLVALRRLAHHRYGEGADYGNYALKLFEIGDKQRAKLNAEKAREIFLQIGLPKIVEMMEDLISKCE